MIDRLVSILLPTRGRPENLKNTIESLFNNATNLEDIEILVKADEDDKASQDLIASIPLRARIVLVVSPRGNGYADLHHMYAELCAHSSGRFLFLWNDDALMLKQGWDRELAKHDDGKLKFLHAGTNDRYREDFFFPIVHRSYYEALGHFSASAHNDTYIYAVMKPYLQHVLRETEILIEHIALQLISQHDQTHLEARYWWSMTKRLWNMPEVQDQLKIDQAKILDLLKQQGVIQSHTLE